jgi:hypothetical protein
MITEIIKVKPLEWKAVAAQDRKAEVADSILGKWEVWQFPVGGGVYIMKPGEHQGTVYEDSYDEAKAYIERVYQRRIAPALSHSPVEQESVTPADFEALASELDIVWVAGLFGSRYGSGAEFLADVAKRLSHAPIAHTFHIDPVSRESVRDEVEGTQSPAPNLSVPSGLGHDVHQQYPDDNEPHSHDGGQIQFLVKPELTDQGHKHHPGARPGSVSNADWDHLESEREEEECDCVADQHDQARKQLRETLRGLQCTGGDYFTDDSDSEKHKIQHNGLRVGSSFKQQPDERSRNCL